MIMKRIIKTTPLGIGIGIGIFNDNEENNQNNTRQGKLGAAHEQNNRGVERSPC